MMCAIKQHFLVLLYCLIVVGVRCEQNSIWSPEALEPMYDRAQQDLIVDMASPTSLLVIQMMTLRHQRDQFVMNVKRYKQNLILHLKRNNCDIQSLWHEVQKADITYKALPLTKYLPTLGQLTELIEMLNNANEFVIIETTILDAEQSSYNDGLVMLRIMVTTFITYITELQNTYASAILGSDEKRKRQMKSIIRKLNPMPEDIIDTINEWLE